MSVDTDILTSGVEATGAGAKGKTSPSSNRRATIARGRALLLMEDDLGQEFRACYKLAAAPVLE